MLIWIKNKQMQPLGIVDVLLIIWKDIRSSLMYLLFLQILKLFKIEYTNIFNGIS